MSKRSAASSAAASAAASNSAATASSDLMSDPRVLRHELRHVKVRLRERNAAFEELATLNQENAKALRQQTVYAKRLEEAWSSLESSLRTIAPTMPTPLPPPSKSSESTRAAAAFTNPVLAMLAHRWSEISGRPVAEMKHAGATALKRASSDSMDVDVDDADEDEDDASASSDATQLESALQQALEQRVAFSQSLLTSVVQQHPPASAGPDAARLALLQSENLSLHDRLHAGTNELLLLNATVTERDQRIDALDEKYKVLLRRYERLKEDVEAGKTASVATTKTEDAASAATTDTVQPQTNGNGVKTENGIKLDGASAARFSAAAARAASATDTHPMPAEDRTDFSPAALLPAPAAPTASAIAKLREDLSDFTLLSERRLKELKDMKEDKKQLERDLHLARCGAVQNDTAIRQTKLFQTLFRQYEAARQDRTRVEAQLEQLQARYQDEVRLKSQVHAEHLHQMADATRRYDCSYEQAMGEIQSLKKSLLHLQHERDECLATHAHDHDLTHFFAKLRSELLPDMERQLREQAVFVAQYKAEKEQQAQLGQGEAAQKTNFARVMRVWKQQETALKAEIKALQEYVASSASSASAASSASLSVRVSSLEHENAALKQQLGDLRASDPSSLQSELDQQNELNHVLGEELNTLSSAHEDAQALATRLTNNAVDFTKTLDKFRQEKSHAAKSIGIARQEVAAGKAKLEQLETALQLQVRVGKEAKALAERTSKESAKLKEEITQSQSTVEEVRSGQAQQRIENSEFKTKYTQLVNQHSKCEEEMEELRQRDVKSSESNRRVAEAHVLLKGRFKHLSSQVGDASGSKKRQLQASSDDADVIKSMKLLLNCRVCETQQKSRVITKCMHAFCADCVQANLDSRLRKCPQCGLKFGESDVKQLYL